MTSDKPFKGNIGSAGSSVRGERIVENRGGFNRGSAFAEAPARQVTRMPLIQDGKERNPGHQSDYEQKVTKKTKFFPANPTILVAFVSCSSCRSQARDK